MRARPDPKGVVKVTPAHDPKDFECGERHNLPENEVIDKDGRICGAVDARFLGMDRFDARERVVEELKALGLYVDKVRRARVTVWSCCVVPCALTYALRLLVSL